MNNRMNIKNNKGVTLIELLITITIISLLAGIGIPQYSRFVADGRIRGAAGDLVQHMRLARTMAIKENRQYLITFNEAGADSYSIGFDGNGDNSLTDTAADKYGAGPVRTYDLAASYGEDVSFGTGTDEGPHSNDPCPVCEDITGATVDFGGTAGPVREVFNPDGTLSFTGSAYITHTSRGFTYLVRVSNRAGKIDLWKWDADIDPTKLSDQCTVSPRRQCTWLEVR